MGSGEYQPPYAAGRPRAVATTVINQRPVAITGNYDEAARVWDLTTGRTTATLTGHTYGVHAVVTTRIRNRPVAITGSGDGTARVWDLTTGRTTATLTGHTGPVLTVATAHLGNRPVAITTSIDDAARVWDLTTASCLTVIDLPASPHCAEFAPDGTVVLGMDHEVVVLTLEPLLRRLR